MRVTHKKLSRLSNAYQEFWHSQNQGTFSESGGRRRKKLKNYKSPHGK